ncbi:hypothetical protein TIFTF001_025135 [Ficus carica]|uniref:Uncharacterized protein n=1 Tax=Ficus carica TaxID=3494 RepID=A0AA88DKI0_FICCA|nr:hypothetical protein TIFTF001_025135 [Ficus carica]
MVESRPAEIGGERERGRGEREWREGGRDWRRGREGEARERLEGGVTVEEMGFEGEFGG